MLRAEIAATAHPITEAALEPTIAPNVRPLGYAFGATLVKSSISEVADELLETGFYPWYVQPHTLQPHTHTMSVQSHYNQCQSKLTWVLFRDFGTNLNEFTASFGHL